MAESNWCNAASIQDELLFNLVQVVEGDAHISPAFLYSLAGLVDALVLHDTAYFNAGWGSSDGDGLESRVRNSALVADLVRANILQRWPAEETVDEALAASGTDYRCLDFIADHKWMLYSCCFPDSESEREQYDRLAIVLNEFPGILRSKRIMDLTEITNQDAQRLFEVSPYTENLHLFEGHNHVAEAHVQLSKHLRLSPYFVLSAIPHQIGAIERCNQPERPTQVLSWGRQGTEEVSKSTPFYAVPSPAICGNLLVNMKGDLRALVPEIVRLREQYGSIRKLLSERESCATVIGIDDWPRECQSLWESQFPGEALFRWVYPLKKLEGESHQVRSIGAWWRLFMGSQVATEIQIQLASFRKGMCRADTWSSAISLGRKIDAYCRRRP